VKYRSIRVVKFYFILIYIAMLTSCASSESDTNPHNTKGYEGFRTQITINNDIGLQVTQDSLLAMAMTGIANQRAYQHSFAVYRKDIGEQQSASPGSSEVIRSRAVNRVGDCGGQASFQFQYHDGASQRYASAEAVFNNYCVSNIVLTGTMHSTVNDQALTMNVSYDDLEIKTYTVDQNLLDSMLLNGEVDYQFLEDFQAGTLQVKLVIDNKVLSQEDNRVTYWLDNVEVEHLHSPGTYDEQWSGKIYISDYGYVDISTPDILVAPNFNVYLLQGEVSIRGANDGQLLLSVLSEQEKAQFVSDNPSRIAGDFNLEIVEDIESEDTIHVINTWANISGYPFFVFRGS